MLHWGRWRRVSMTAPTPKRGRIIPATASWVIKLVSQPAPARMARPSGMLAQARARIKPGTITASVVMTEARVKNRTS